MKILTERYPDLQAQQVSCHAAHKEGERIHPCGKCEKCRRIVCILLALDGDPQRCGYTPEQITRCLDSVAREGTHLEPDAENFLLATLLQKDRITLSEEKRAALREDSSVLKARFHPVRSPLETLPEDLRRPIYSIMLEHGDGALRWEEEGWIPFHPLASK